MDEHVKISTGVKACTCRKCGKSFTKKRLAVVHAKEKIYPCTKCSKQFGSLLARSEHLRQAHVNTGVKQQQCKKCGKCFHRNQQQSKPMSHVGVNKHKCSECGKSFDQKKVVNCKRCGKCFHRNKKVSCGKKDSKPEEKTTDTTLRCWICGEEPAFKSSLVDQFKPQDMGFRYTCPQCEGNLESASNLGSYFQTFSDMLELMDDGKVEKEKK